MPIVPILQVCKELRFPGILIFVQSMDANVVSSKKSSGEASLKQTAFLLFKIQINLLYKAE